MRKKMIALVLALAMVLGLLTGCGASAPAAEDENQTQETQNPAAEEAGESELPQLTEIPEQAREDPVAYLTDGAVHMGDTVMTVNGTDISAGAYFYWLASQYSSTAQNYLAYGAELDLNEVVDEQGTTVADYLFNQAKTFVELNAIINDKSAELGLSLSEEQTAQEQELEQGFDENALLYYATSLKDVISSYEGSCMAANVQDYLYGENGTEKPDTQELAGYAEENGTYTCRYILFYTADLAEDDAQGKAAQQAAAQEIYDQLAACPPEELEQTFTQLQAEHNYDGNTEPFTFSDGDSLVDGFREKVAQMQPGELGMTDETGYGYFVLLRLDTDLAGLEEDYISYLYDLKLDQWVNEAQVQGGEVLDGLDHVQVLQSIGQLQNVVLNETSAADAAQTETGE